jgi:hypothetical protein
MKLNLQARRKAAQAILEAYNHVGMPPPVSASSRSVIPKRTNPKLAAIRLIPCFRDCDRTMYGNVKAVINQTIASARLKISITA